MFDTLQERVTRIYNGLIGINKNIDPNRQTIQGELNPEKMLCNTFSPEYRLVDEFSLQIATQLSPSTAESLIYSNIGSLEEWGEMILKRPRGEDEDPETYRELILTAWMPVARGGDRQDLLDWALEIDGVRRVYPYVGNDPDAITVDDIEGRLDGGFVFVQSDNGVPTGAELTAVNGIYFEKGSISVSKLAIAPIIERPYDFTYQLKESVTGGGSSGAEVEDKVRDITYNILDETQPYIKYVDQVRRDLVVAGQYLNEIRNIITKPPYRYTIEDIQIEQGGNDIQVEMLPAGNIPIIGSITFV